MRIRRCVTRMAYAKSLLENSPTAMTTPPAPPNVVSRRTVGQNARTPRNRSRERRRDIAAMRIAPTRVDRQRGRDVLRRREIEEELRSAGNAASTFPFASRRSSANAQRVELATMMRLLASMTIARCVAGVD